MEEQKKQGRKKPGQKFKSLLVWDILQKRTDENYAISMKKIVEHLKMYGISAERHSIKRDIDDILILLNKDMETDLDEHDIEDRALLGYEVEYDAVQHGYKVSRRPYDFEELRSAFGLPSSFPKARKNICLRPSKICAVTIRLKSFRTKFTL